MQCILVKSDEFENSYPLYIFFLNPVYVAVIYVVVYVAIICIIIVVIVIMIIVSITKFSIVIGSPRAYLSHN